MVRLRLQWCCSPLATMSPNQQTQQFWEHSSGRVKAKWVAFHRGPCFHPLAVPSNPPSHPKKKHTPHTTHTTLVFPYVRFTLVFPCSSLEDQTAGGRGASRGRCRGWPPSLSALCLTLTCTLVPHHVYHLPGPVVPVGSDGDKRPTVPYIRGNCLHGPHRILPTHPHPLSTSLAPPPQPHNATLLTLLQISLVAHVGSGSDEWSCQSHANMENLSRCASTSPYTSRPPTVACLSVMADEVIMVGR